MKIVVEIERLVLDGVTVNRRDGHLLGAALERELGRLLSIQAPLRQAGPIGAVSSLTAPDAVLDSNPTGMGNLIAAAVHTTLIPKAEKAK